MPQTETAIVVVSKEWIDTAVRHLINQGRESRSTGETHLIFADLDDLSDHRGLWLKNVKTNRLTVDASDVTMRFMIPWSVIVGLGVVDRGTAAKAGFSFEPASDLTDQSTSTEEEASPT